MTTRMAPDGMWRKSTTSKGKLASVNPLGPLVGVLYWFRLAGFSR
jgi:hypothetical protein